MKATNTVFKGNEHYVNIFVTHLFDVQTILKVSNIFILEVMK